MKFKNPFRAITTAEHMTRRVAEASANAEHHRRKAIDADDAASWATVQAENHRRLAAHYDQISNSMKGLA